MKRGLLFLLAVAVVIPVTANPIAVGVVLVPINPGAVAGAAGSQWVTTLWARNPTDSGARIESDGDISGWPQLSARSTTILSVPYSGLTHPGFFLHTRSANGFFGPPDIWLELRALDSASASHTAGTTIPLPTMDEFRSGTIAFPNVPANGHSRIKLRIYSTSNSSVVVRTYNGDELVQSTTPALTGADQSGPAPRFPAYAEIDLPNAASAAMRVEVDATAATWAFVSVTDDVTNEFTIVAPHLPSLVVLSNL
jgi:hypothetical protein